MILTITLLLFNVFELVASVILVTVILPLSCSIKYEEVDIGSQSHTVAAGRIHNTVEVEGSLSWFGGLLSCSMLRQQL
jgi:hypothetical protein